MTLGSRSSESREFKAQKQIKAALSGPPFLFRCAIEGRQNWLRTPTRIALPSSKWKVQEEGRPEAAARLSIEGSEHITTINAEPQSPQRSLLRRDSAFSAALRCTSSSSRAVT